MRKKNQGITLIALVITIIVLLILAGITILSLMGENGILGKGQKASNETDKQTAAEKLNLKITNIQMDVYVEKKKMPTLKELSLSLKTDEEIAYITEKSQKIADVKYEVPSENPSSIYTKLNEYPYEFEIDNQLRLASIDGVSIADNNTNQQETVSREEYNALLSRIETLENQPKNIERVSLNNTPIIIPTTTTNTEKDFASINLSDSIEQFKYLEIQYDILYQTTSEACEETKFIATNQLKYNNSNTPNWQNGSTMLLKNGYATNGIVLIGVWFKNNKLLQVGVAFSESEDYIGMRIKAIYGIR